MKILRYFDFVLRLLLIPIIAYVAILFCIFLLITRSVKIK